MTRENVTGEGVSFVWRYWASVTQSGPLSPGLDIVIRMKGDSTINITISYTQPSIRLLLLSSWPRSSPPSHSLSDFIFQIVAWSILLCLPITLSSPLLPSLPSLLSPLPGLLQTVVSGGGAAGGGAGAAAGVGGTTAVTTLPAPITTTMTTAPAMATMAPGIAIGILKALLVGRTSPDQRSSSIINFQTFSTDNRKYQETAEEISPRLLRVWETQLWLWETKLRVWETFLWLWETKLWPSLSLNSSWYEDWIFSSVGNLFIFLWMLFNKSSARHLLLNPMWSVAGFSFSPFKRNKIEWSFHVRESVSREIDRNKDEAFNRSF